MENGISKNFHVPLNSLPSVKTAKSSRARGRMGGGGGDSTPKCIYFRQLNLGSPGKSSPPPPGMPFPITAAARASKSWVKTAATKRKRKRLNAGVNQLTAAGMIQVILNSPDNTCDRQLHKREHATKEKCFWAVLANRASLPKYACIPLYQCTLIILPQHRRAS